MTRGSTKNSRGEKPNGEGVEFWVTFMVPSWAASRAGPACHDNARHPWRPSHDGGDAD